jgi:hypothetical protein
VIKCPPIPALQFVREPCHFCGAANEIEAGTKCRPSTDETGERYCGTDFDDEGFSIAPTKESLALQDDWYGTHYDCFRFCVAVVGSPAQQTET